MPSILITGTVLLTFFIILITIYFQKKKKASSKNLPPYSSLSRFQMLKSQLSQRGIWRFEQILKESNKIANTRYGAIFRSHSIPLLFPEQYIVTDYKLASLILSGDHEKKIKESIKRNIFTTMNLIDRKINNVFTARSEDADRVRARKFIAPAFSNINLQKIVPHLNENIDNIFQLFDELAVKNEPIEIGDVILHLMMSTLAKSSFDVDFSHLKEVGAKTEGANPSLINTHSFLHDMDTLIKERMKQLVLPYRKYLTWTSSFQRAKSAQDHIREVAQYILDANREKKKQSTASSDRMEFIIDRIISHNYPEPSPDTHRLSDILTFVLAGHETSSNTLCFFLYELARHPSQQKKLQEELDDHLRDLHGNGHPTYSQISKLEYLNNCLRESMRLWPTVPIIARTTVEEIEYDGIVIPERSLIQCNLYSIFHASWIGQPNEYIPERWSPGHELYDEKLREMFMPFAEGHRNCIGQNMAMIQLKILIANIVKNYEFELVEERDLKGDVEIEMALLMKIKKLVMRIKKR